MNDKKKIEKPLRIQYSILEVAKISHWERDPAEYGLSTEDLKKHNLELQVACTIDDEKEVIAYNIKAQFEYLKGKEKLNLLGIESIHKFKIKDFKTIFKSQNPGEWNIPDNFMTHLIAISSDGTRGMLAALTTNPAYKDFILPPLDTRKVVEDLQNKMKRRS